MRNCSAVSRVWIVILLACVLGSQAYGASNFVRVPLGAGASIEIPRNWVVLSKNQRVTIDSYVESKGYRLTEAALGFAANLYDDQGKTIAVVNSRIYPENPFTQAHARQVTSEILPSLDMSIRTEIESTLGKNGVRLLDWSGSRMEEINGQRVLVHKHKQSGATEIEATYVRGIRMWRSPRSFTVTLSYRDRDAELITPIIDYMTQSIRAD